MHSWDTIFSGELAAPLLEGGEGAGQLLPAAWLLQLSGGWEEVSQLADILQDFSKVLPILHCSVAKVPLESEMVFVCSEGVYILFAGVAEAALASVLQRRPLAGGFVP